jgi:ribonucleoside-diphosphate reductase alpha chain
VNNYREFIYKSRYAKWIEKEQRRETWEETVNRYINHFKKELTVLGAVEEVRKAIINMDVVPSMRALATAGAALEKDNVAGFNCAYVACDHQKVFDEILYILMCGTGVGFSVERQYITKLPEVAEDFHDTDTIIRVTDSKIGWAKAFRELLSLLYSGQIPKWDTSKLRPAGARLHTFGGRSSGPEPLEQLFQFSVDTFRAAAGRKLNSIECHDLICKVASCVVVGGVRRSALISLSNLTDDRMRRAKQGEWYTIEPQRSYANNSACYTEKPDFDSFLNEWVNLYESKSGERGIFNRVASQRKAAENDRRDTGYDFGTNPCSEIILRSAQFCNLSEVIIRNGDGFNELKRKVRLATILGTVQATRTDFRYLRKIWRNNTEEEALLGVSLTGIMDHPVLNGTEDGYTCDVEWFVNHAPEEEFNLGRVLKELKNVAITTNKKSAKKLGINPSAAITCVKPSGTVSQLVDSSSGIHARYAPYYIRRVRADEKDPLAQMMIEQGIPHEADLVSANTVVFSFPIASPRNSVHEACISSLDMLQLWKDYQEHWCEHKPSVTIHYKDEEFLGVGDWVYNNFDNISGISFLPKTTHTYAQAPYEEITKEEYEKLKSEQPDIDFSKLSEYEKEDNTIGSQTLACTGSSCEIVDLTN